MLVTPHRQRALWTVFLFMGATLGAMEIVEAFDDALDERGVA